VILVGDGYGVYKKWAYGPQWAPGLSEHFNFTFNPALSKPGIRIFMELRLLCRKSKTPPGNWWTMFHARLIRFIKLYQGGTHPALCDAVAWTRPWVSEKDDCFIERIPASGGLAVCKTKESIMSLICGRYEHSLRSTHTP